MAVPSLNIDDSLASPSIIPHIVSNYARTVESPNLTRDYPTVKNCKIVMPTFLYDSPTPPTIIIVASTSNFC